jgi:hypothetical protein
MPGRTAAVAGQAAVEYAAQPVGVGPAQGALRQVLDNHRVRGRGQQDESGSGLHVPAEGLPAPAGLHVRAREAHCLVGVGDGHGPGPSGALILACRAARTPVRGGEPGQAPKAKPAARKSSASSHTATAKNMKIGEFFSQPYEARHCIHLVMGGGKVVEFHEYTAPTS